MISNILNNKIYAEKNIRNIISDILFYAGIMCELVVSFTGYLIGGYHESAIIVSGMALFSLSILFGFDFKCWKRELLMCGTLCLYGLACYYFQSQAFVLRIVLAILAGRKHDAKKVISLFFIGTLAGMLYYGFLSLLGMHNKVYVEDSFRSVIERRYTFGFYHPNGYALFLFRTVVMGFYLFADRMKLFIYMLYSAVSIALIVTSKSKIGILLMITAVVLFGLYKYAGKKIVSVLSIMMSSAVLLLWLYIRFQDYIPANEVTFKLWMFVDKITTGRSGDTYYAMRDNAITLFGRGAGVQISEMGIFDSLYRQGIIFMIAFVGVTVWLFIKKLKSNEMATVIVIALTICYATAECFLEYFNKNMIWLLCIGCLCQINKEHQDGKE